MYYTTNFKQVFENVSSVFLVGPPTMDSKYKKKCQLDFNDKYVWHKVNKWKIIKSNNNNSTTTTRGLMKLR